jgi:hypothetical protein
MDDRGNLSFIENMADLPFNIERVFWTYDVPGGETRGGHAYHKSEELLVALSGSFDVVVKTAEGDQTFSLNRSYYGLYLPAMTWKHLENFSTNALCLTLSSTHYDKSDYIYDVDQFQKFMNEVSQG